VIAGKNNELAMGAAMKADDANELLEELATVPNGNDEVQSRLSSLSFVLTNPGIFFQG